MKRQTLTQYLLNQLVAHPEQKDLVLMMSDLAVIGKILSEQTNKIGLTTITQSTQSTNIQGEDVKELDIVANELCKNYLRQTGHFIAMASEEEEGVVDMSEENPNGKYIIAFDPLDGVSNIDANIGVGTIFSVYKKDEDRSPADEKQFLRAGKDQVIAGYILYSTSTTLVFSLGDGTHECTLDQGTGEFFMSKENLKIPETCKNFSTNSTYVNYQQSRDKEFTLYLRDELGASDRHVGSLVADIHRNLVQGGVFMYFANDKKEKGTYKPKLRMLYELQPIGFLVEQAGGLAVDENGNLLEKIPKSLHERSAVVMGNKKEVEKY